ncbi:MAG: tetratricopeptide repeat protein [Polyangiaceae bacterium]|nr:tetratricopeptide repeat protein [Polyangiaceae bacterium]
MTGRASVSAFSPKAVAPTPHTPSSPGADVGAGRDSTLRGLTGSLRDAGRLTSNDRVEKQLSAATAAVSAGDLLGAAGILRSLMEVNPDRPDIAAEYRRVRAELAKSQAESYQKQAIREEKLGMWGAAALSWSRVAEGRPDSALALRSAAFCIVRSNGDLRRARDLAQRATELAPADVSARVVLGRVYLAAGMKMNARRELEAAAKLDPKDELVKNLLRELST